MQVNEREPDMDILWLLAAAGFFAGCNGLVRFINNLRAED